MSVQTRDFLKRRRDRALGSIMGHLERSAAWPRMSDEQRSDLRNCVVEALNSYHDTILDLVKAEDDVVRNEEVLTLLRRVEGEVKRQGRAQASAQLGMAAPIDRSITAVDGQFRADAAR